MHRQLVKIAAGLVFWGVWAGSFCLGAEYTTRNFRVNAPTDDVAKKVGEAAEFFRKQIAIEWLGYELPRWAERCPIKVKVGQIGAGGETTFNFHPVPKGRAEVCDWNMKVQGSLERILDSVIPHEVSHTIFACHFRRPLPRWADEGAATLVECESERRVQVLTVEEVIKTRRRIPFKQLLGTMDYPKDPQAVRTLYAEGYSLAELLVQEGGKAKYLLFLDDAQKNGWDKAISKHYPYSGIDGLEARWKEWVMAGSPEINRNPTTLVADANAGKSRINRGDDERLTVRGQSPDNDNAADRPKVASRESKTSRDANSNRLTAPTPRRKSKGANLNDDDGSDTSSRVVVATQPETEQESRELPRRSPKDDPARSESPKRSPREIATARTDRSQSEGDLFEDEESLNGATLEIEEESIPPARPQRKRSTDPSGRAIARGGLAPQSDPGVSGRRASYSEFPDDARPQVALLPEELR